MFFFSTWLIYAGHRYVSLAKVEADKKEDVPSRLANVRAYRKLFPYLATLALGIVIFCAYPMSIYAWYALPVAGLIAGTYVLPIWKGYRLRDVPFVKIFMVAVVWSYVTVILPAGEAGLGLAEWGWMALERMIFIFAITLPFDLRDIAFDKAQGVSTFATRLGVKGTLFLSLGLLFVWMVMVGVLYVGWWWIAFAAAGIGTIVLVYLSPRFLNDDWYFTGWLDGTMLLQPVLVIGVDWLML